MILPLSLFFLRQPIICWMGWDSLPVTRASKKTEEKLVLAMSVRPWHIIHQCWGSRCAFVTPAFRMCQVLLVVVGVCRQLLSDKACWICSRAHGSEKSLWLAVQLSELVLENRNWKKKGKTRERVVQVCFHFHLCLFASAICNFYQTCSWLEMALLVRVVSNRFHNSGLWNHILLVSLPYGWICPHRCHPISASLFLQPDSFLNAISDNSIFTVSIFWEFLGVLQCLE